MKISRRVRILGHFSTPGDMSLFLQILFFALTVPVLLRLLRLPTIANVIEPKHAPSTPDTRQVQKTVHYVDLVLRKGKPFIHPGCLTRGLTLYTFLRRAGLKVTLCFGIGNLGEQAVGHCWLVKDGEPFLETKDPRLFFTVTYSFPL